MTKLAASKTALTLCAIVAISLTVPSLAVSAPPAPQPLQDSVTGSGASRFCGGGFEVNAQSGPSGENPTGQLTCGSFFGGTVTCLNVSGNVALLTVSDGPFAPPLAIRIIDNGASGDVAGVFPASGPSCQSPLPGYADIDVAGDLVVVDAPVLPTSKEQCKNGGYTSFQFKNQGECVAFIERGSKPKP